MSDKYDSRRKHPSYQDFIKGNQYKDLSISPQDFYPPDKLDERLRRGEYTKKANDKVETVSEHDVLTIKDLLTAILNTLDEQQNTLERHGEYLEDLCDILIDDDD